MLKFLSVLLACTALLSAVQVHADEESSLTLRGFGTLGAARTNTQDAEFVRDLSQPKGAVNRWDGRLDSIIGGQVNWRLTPGLEAVVQAVSRYRYDNSYTPDISWAYLKYDPTPQVSLRAGRLGTEFFMMADSRLVGYSYLPVRPPGDFFWFLPFYSIDGADAAVTLPVGENLVRAKVYYGISNENIPLSSKQWKLNGSDMVGGYVDYQAGAWVLRASYANIRFQNNLPIDDVLNAYLAPAQAAAASHYLASADTRSHYFSLGGIYDSGPWQVQLMFNKANQGSEAFESSRAGYFLAGYRIGEVTPFVGYSWMHSKPRVRTQNPVIDSIMADSHSDQKTTMVGARWDLTHNLALKAQWDGIRGEPSSIFPFRGEQPSWSGKMDVFSLTMDFIF